MPRFSWQPYHHYKKWLFCNFSLFVFIYLTDDVDDDENSWCTHWCRHVQGLEEWNCEARKRHYSLCTNHVNFTCNLPVLCAIIGHSVLFFSPPRSEGWPHHGRTFSIYPCPLSFWLTLPRRVLSTSFIIIGHYELHIHLLYAFRAQSALHNALALVTQTHVVWPHQPENPPGRPRARRISPWRSPSLFPLSYSNIL